MPNDLRDDDVRPARVGRLPAIWRDAGRVADLEAALSMILQVKNPDWRRRFRQRAEVDHLTPRAIRRGVTLLSRPTVRLWVLHDCLTPGCAVLLQDAPLATYPVIPVVRLRTVRPPERAAAS
jgi:hypothetical protein